MKIELKKISQFEELESIRGLYCEAFPPEERREFDDLKQLVFGVECVVNQIITANSKVAGFCVYWIFDEFVYVEHFAVFPGLRGRGIGEGTLSVLREKFKVLILETELPMNEISQRRIKFYKRNGFHLLNLHYVQPSYGDNKPEVELKLMCTSSDISAEILNNYIIQIKEKVYC